jgi:ABC-type lipopolysaccharide export system ATPase subunit
MTTALEIDDVHKWFGNHHVLDSFSLRVEQGEVVGLLGPNAVSYTHLRAHET